MEYHFRKPEVWRHFRRHFLAPPEVPPGSNLFIKSRCDIFNLPLNTLLQLFFCSVIGDVMGSAMSNIDSLLKMPYGCGEQNMVHFVPNIFIMRYLEATGRQDPKIKGQYSLTRSLGLSLGLSLFLSLRLSHTRTLTRTHTHAHTYARTHTYTHTNIYTHTVYTHAHNEK